MKRTDKIAKDTAKVVIFILCSAIAVWTLATVTEADACQSYLKKGATTAYAVNCK